MSVREGDGLRQQERLRDVDAAGLSKKAGFAWVPVQGAVQYVWPTPHANPALDIGLASGETVSVTVELDPYHAIHDEKPSDNRRTKSLSCP